jgi:hypothetical protein
MVVRRGKYNLSLRKDYMQGGGAGERRQDERMTTCSVVWGPSEMNRGSLAKSLLLSIGVHIYRTCSGSKLIGLDGVQCLE